MLTAWTLMDDPLWNAPVLSGYVHGVYAGAINIEFALADGERRLFTVLCQDGSPPLPDCAALPPDRFAALSSLQPGAAAQKRGERLFLGSGALTFARIPQPQWRIKRGDLQENAFPDICQTLGDFCQSSGQPSGFSKIPEQRRTDLRDFSNALIRSDAAALMGAFSRLVGCGIGLTPTCDDAMTGALAFAFGAFSSEAIPGGRQRYFALAKPLLQELLDKTGKTTSVSEKYLKCALRGVFSPAWEQLVRAALTGDRNSFLRALADISRMGHTSGMDALIGAASFAKRLASIISRQA